MLYVDCCQSNSDNNWHTHIIGVSKCLFSGKLVVGKRLSMNVTSIGLGFDFQLFLNANSGSSVAFSCEYETHVSINTASLQIEQDTLSSGEIDAVSGTFASGISINYYSSSAFDTVDDSESRLSGSDIFIGITWSVNSLVDKVLVNK